MTDATIPEAVLHSFCPMYVRLNDTGHIISCGTTVQKFRPDVDLCGQRFLEVFELTRPRRVSSVAEMLDRSGSRLHLQFRTEPRTSLSGVAVPLPDGGALVNLSPGIAVIDAVRDYALSGTDFAVTDLAVELLFLVEANTAAMEASRHLNLRLQGAKIAAEEQAYTDTLTGLKNRRALEHILARLSITHVSFALLHLDLDYFKSVNDTMGHAAGDHVLQQVAHRMVHETRDSDTIARVGGDEFVLILDGIDDRERLDRIASRLIARLEDPIPFQGQTCRVSASIGIALSGQRMDGELAKLVEDADTALYAAKAAGRGCHRFYERRADPPFHADLQPANDRREPGGAAADVSSGRGRSGSA